MLQPFWSHQSIETVFEKFQTNSHGLTNEQAKRRLEEEGPNALPEEKSRSLFSIFLSQFNSPLIYVLFGAAAIVLWLGEILDAVVITGVLILNSLIGTFQEGKARSTLSALKNFTTTEATVIRGGEELTIPDHEVVPGDIILLYEGEKVPADSRLILSNNLQVDESSLTGESEPVRKTTDVLAEGAVAVSDQTNMVFKGSHISAGSGRAVVVATGISTVIGGIAQKISSIDSEIPLEVNIRHLSKAIVVVVAVISVILFIVGLGFGQSPRVMFTTVVSLAVSVIPEGLPIVLTIVLATGVWRMSKRQALVKKLQAVEALGQADIIAVDKTGTITRNELVVRKVWTAGDLFDVSGIGYSKQGEVTLGGTPVSTLTHPALLRLGLALSRAASAHLLFDESTKRLKVAGDPTEAAMIILAAKLGLIQEQVLSRSPIVVDLPFDYKKKYKAVVTKDDQGHTLTVVGAPEAVMGLATHIRDGERLELLSKERQAELHIIFETLSAEGLRVVATAVASRVAATTLPTQASTLVFEGFLAMQDALRPEVREAMDRAKAAGIKVVMITGDHATTAKAIAREAGIYQEGNSILTGLDIETLSDIELDERVLTASVYARVTPEHKLRIIESYRRLGQVVAMTGDGVNDAPSLVAADLGVAMGKIGTEVAKEASDIVLLDDNFGSIVSAVEEGRSIYKTIKKVMLYLFSTSTGEVLIITGAIMLGYPLPLLAVQIIWLNLVTDGFLDVALAMDPKEKNLLSDKFNRPGRFLVDSLMLVRMLVMALPMMVGTLWVFSQYVYIDLPTGMTMALTTMAAFQWFNVWSCRSETKSIFALNPFSNLYLVGATGIVIGLQLLAVYHPWFQLVLKTVPLSLSEWGIAITVAVSIVIVEEIRKFMMYSYKVISRQN